MTAHRLAVQTLLVRKLEQWRVAESKRGYRWGYRKFCESYEFNIYKALQASFNRPQPTICPSKPSKELSLEGFFIEIQRVINNTY